MRYETFDKLADNVMLISIGKDQGRMMSKLAMTKHLEENFPFDSNFMIDVNRTWKERKKYLSQFSVFKS